MFARTLCVFCLLASPAAADLEITSDYTITESNAPHRSEWIHVYGDATLTMDTDGSGDGPWGIGNIVLHDSSSFVLHRGEVDGNLRLDGNNTVTMTGGSLDGELVGYEGSSSTIDITGGELHFGNMDLRHGAHTVSLSGVTSQFNFLISGDINLTAYSDDPRYFITGGGYAQLRMGDYSISVQNKNWLLYPTAQIEPADTNLDGFVDLEDLNAVRNNFGGINDGFGVGDTFPLDGRIDLTDLNRIRNSFGVSQPVPEPSSFVLAAILLIASLLKTACR